MTKALNDEIEKMKLELSSLDGEQDDTQEEELEESNEGEEDPAPQEVVEEAPKEEPKPVEEPKEELDGSAYARMRRENAALKKQLQEREAPKQEAEVSSIDDTIMQSVVEREKLGRAAREFSGMVEEFKAHAPSDFAEITNAYESAVYQSLRVQNPRLTHDQLVEQTTKTLLYKASSYLNQGFNPVEEMYHEAKALGLKPAPKQEQPAPEQDIRPDLDKIAANKRRNAGTAGAKGSAGSAGQMTATALADLPAHEYAKIPPSERKRIIQNIGG